MTRILNQLIAALVVGVLGAVVICGAGPFYRQHMATKGFDKARNELDGHKPDEALAELHRVENWSQRYPNIASDVTAEMIRAYLRADRFEHALNKAEWQRTTPLLRTSGIPHPALTHSLPDMLYNKLNPAMTHYSEWHGYRVLAEELRGLERSDEMRELMQQLIKIDPQNEVLDLIRKNAKRPPPRRTDPVRKTYDDTPITETPVVRSVDPESIGTEGDGPSGHWMVTTQETGAYNSDAQYLRTLEPGTFGDIVRRDKLKGKDVVVANLHYKGKLVRDVYIVPRNVFIQEGSVFDLSPDAKRKHIRSIELAGQIEKRKEQLKNEKSGSTASTSSGNNPHQQAYEKKKQEVLAFNKKGESLVKSFESAQGDKRMKIAADLRAMKNEQIHLMEDFNALKAKKQEWDRKNPSKPAPPPAAKGPDPKLQELQRELIALQKELKQN